MNNKTKSIVLLIIATVALLVMVGVVVFTVVNNNKEKKSVGEISYTKEKFDKYYNSEEPVVIYYASSQCGYCSMQTPILEELAKTYNIEYLYIDSIKLSALEREDILEKLGIEHATPTTVVVQKGEVVDVAIGYHNGTEYTKFLVETGVLPKDASYNVKKTLEDAPNVTVVDYNDYEELIASGELFVVTIGQTGCSHCTAIKPALDRVVTKDGLKIHYLNLTDLVGSERSAFFNSLIELEFNDPNFVESGSFGTPTTFTIENGKIKYYIAGERTYSQLSEEFRKQGLID